MPYENELQICEVTLTIKKEKKKKTLKLNILGRFDFVACALWKNITVGKPNIRFKNLAQCLTFKQSDISCITAPLPLLCLHLIINFIAGLSFDFMHSFKLILNAKCYYSNFLPKHFLETRMFTSKSTENLLAFWQHFASKYFSLVH